MSCEECEKIEIENMNGKNLAYIRIGNATVLVCACDKHFNELRVRMGMGVQYDSPVVRIQ